MSMKQLVDLLYGTKLRLFLVESMHNHATARLTVSVIDDEATLSLHYQGKRQEIARIDGLQRTERQKGRDVQFDLSTPQGASAWLERDCGGYGNVVETFEYYATHKRA